MNHAFLEKVEPYLDTEDRIVREIAAHAEGLCLQLSKEGFPKINDYVNQHDAQTVDFEEAAYGYYRIIGAEHSKLEQWGREAAERDDRYGKLNPPIADKMIGRNERCLCGSGKKYKKCCGK